MSTKFRGFFTCFCPFLCGFNPFLGQKTVIVFKNENTPYILSDFDKILQKAPPEKYVKRGYYIFLYFFENVK